MADHFAVNPRLLPRFVDGLDWHWDNEDRTSFNRHAPITQLIRGYQAIKRSARQSGKPVSEHSGSDFPGAAGVFIHDYACALALADEPQERWRDQLMAFCDSWWNRRRDDGVLDKSGGKSALNWNGADLSQTLGHAQPLLDAAEALDACGREPEIAATLRERGQAYMRSLLDIDQPQIDDGGVVMSFNPDGSAFKVSQAWAGNRGHAATAKSLLQILNAADAAGDERGLELALRGAACYHDNPLPRDLMMRAGDPGAAIALVTECYRRTNDARWMDTALSLATEALEVYFDAPTTCSYRRAHCGHNRARVNWCMPWLAWCWLPRGTNPLGVSPDRCSDRWTLPPGELAGIDRQAQPDS